MRFNADIHRRRSIRLRNFGYGSAGAYYVTIVTQGREAIFGEVIDSSMLLNERGHMVWDVWRDIPRQYPGIEIDAFVVMPNHTHGIVVITDVGAGPRACPDQTGQSHRLGQPQGVAPTPLSLQDVVHRFKSLTTTKYRRCVSTNGWPSFPGRLWQRNYWERVIRDEPELNRIRQYISDNPANWNDDPERLQHPN